jgi:hypothetical protein
MRKYPNTVFLLQKQSIYFHPRQDFDKGELMSRTVTRGVHRNKSSNTKTSK